MTFPARTGWSSASTTASTAPSASRRTAHSFYNRDANAVPVPLYEADLFELFRRISPAILFPRTWATAWRYSTSSKVWTSPATRGVPPAQRPLWVQSRWPAPDLGRFGSHQAIPKADFDAMNGPERLRKIGARDTF